MPEQDYELDEISIHAPRVGSDARLDAGFGVGREISIHAPRVGSDVFDVDSHKSLAISIHAPRVGSDRSIYSLFPSGWISIHAPRVGSDLRPPPSQPGAGGISIHAPRVGSDRKTDTTAIPAGKFQSTLPVWGATAEISKDISEKVYNFIYCTKSKMLASAYRPSPKIFSGIFSKIRCEPP